jgi:excinuclease UvrABC helicase subunit UvrB
LALRFQAPIFTYQNILDKAGIYLQINPEEEEEEDAKIEGKENEPLEIEIEKDNTNALQSKTLSELKSLLQEAVNNEDYEMAAKVRDEISKR